MPWFREKPVEVEAMRIASSTTLEPNRILTPNTESIAAISGWMMGKGFKGFKVHGDRAPYGIVIETLDGVMVAMPGDWIIRGVHGEFYPCSPGIFAEMYDPVVSRGS